MSPQVNPDSTEIEESPMILQALKTYHISKLRAFSSVPRVPLYINGKFVESKTSEWIPVHNPVP